MQRAARPTGAFFFSFLHIRWTPTTKKWQPLNNDANVFLLFVQVVVKTENMNFVILGN